MDGRKFEYFCQWLFKQTKQYKKIILTQTTGDEGKDLILQNYNKEKTYVECKHWNNSSSINREIIQKLVGAMVSDNINKGVVITTTHLSQTAWDYICKLEKNTNIKIDILDKNDIKNMLIQIDQHKEIIQNM